MTALLLVRRVPPGRLDLTRATAQRWNDALARDTTLQWWELVDPASDDGHPAAALAAVRPGGPVVRLAGLAIPPGRRDRAVQVLFALVDALRATTARTLEAAPSADPQGLELQDILREAGFRPGLDGREVVEL
ncbi:hypothetical protein AB0M46_14655 [Dactylosporangium sp. NPDC051485]|uniref:hypothetical protein n=1 Tax=Dactylosporangium sp. NPDC051485 TaxID=3154846 RepID=UPI003418BBE1